MPQKDNRVHHWKQYNQVLVNRGSITLFQVLGHSRVILAQFDLNILLAHVDSAQMNVVSATNHASSSEVDEAKLETREADLCQTSRKSAKPEAATPAHLPYVPLDSPVHAGSRKTMPKVEQRLDSEASAGIEMQAM